MLKDKIKWVDIKAIFLFALAYPIALIKKIKYKNLWLFSERPNEARDNGFWMYKFVKENHPEQEAFYVIKKDSFDRKKLLKYGKTVNFGSFRHYVIFLVAKKHISAHVNSDSPNSRVSNFLETHGLLKNKRIFLQHGITKDKISFGYYNVSRADLFVCAALPEYKFCKEEFGYPDGAVQLLGFARYDGLGVIKPQNNIVLMPTWRSWLANASEEEFLRSDYFKKYSELLCSKELNDILNKTKTELIFYPHSDMQKFISFFNVKSDKIIVANQAEYDIQTLLNESKLLITDYSSVAFDFAYMNRPVIYYQFDYEEYRKHQHAEGYFSYKENCFGAICENERILLYEIKKTVDRNFVSEKIYLNRENDFFYFHDQKNCERIYASILEI